MVALQPPRLAFVPLQEAIAKLKLVLPDSEFVVTARALDISFGDRTGAAQRRLACLRLRTCISRRQHALSLR